MQKVIKRSETREREISETRSEWKKTQNKFSVQTLTCEFKKQLFLVKRSPLRRERVPKQRWDNNNRKEWNPRSFTSFGRFLFTPILSLFFFVFCSTVCFSDFFSFAGAFPYPRPNQGCSVFWWFFSCVLTCVFCVLPFWLSVLGSMGLGLGSGFCCVRCAQKFPDW